MTTDPDTPADTRGRHAHPDDEHADGQGTDAQETPAEEKPADEKAPPPATTAPPKTRTTDDEPAKRRSGHSLGHHPAGFALLLSSGLVTGIALAPLLFEQLSFDIATRAARAARSAATPWPAGGEPWFWPSWLATLAVVVAVAVLVVAVSGLRIPDIAVLVAGGLLAVATARAAWATFDVINSRLWELVPLCLVCLAAFCLAATAAARWRSPRDKNPSGGGGGAAGVVVGGWVIVFLVLLAGAAIARSAEANVAGAAGPPQGIPGLLSIRAADGPQLADLRGKWVAQLAAAQLTDDAGATAFSAAHEAAAASRPMVLARGDDVGGPDVDDSWWLSLVQQPFGSQAEVEAWCPANGLTCTARFVSD